MGVGGCWLDSGSDDNPNGGYFGECNKIVANSCCVQIKETGLRHCAIVQELWLPVFSLFGILDNT